MLSWDYTYIIKDHHGSNGLSRGDGAGAEESLVIAGNLFAFSSSTFKSFIQTSRRGLTNNELHALLSMLVRNLGDGRLRDG